MLKKPGNILIIDDDQDILLSARVVLKKQFGSITTEADPGKIEKRLGEGQYDVIMLDMNFHPGATSGKEGLIWLKKIREADPEAHIIMMTAYGDINLAVKAMKEGASDFVVKPWENEKLLSTIINAFRLSRSKKEINDLKNKQHLLSQDLNQQFSKIIGRSESMRELYEMIEKVGKTDANVLITGENGTGKELIARALHRKSERSQEIFVSVDLGALPETLFESELFGHEAGAFTDAREARPGRFEIAAGGTLFLDEIGNLSLQMQAKLLSAIQNRKVTRIGSNKEIPVDIRLISATNMPVFKMVSEKTFREDLLYRINTVVIKVPPLRQRRSDIPLLSNHFLDLYSRKYQKPYLKLSPECYDKLKAYDWPGNVRELQHMLERAIIMSEGNELNPSDFPIEQDNRFSSVKNSLNMEEVEKQTIIHALSQNRQNISKAAQELGLARTTLYRKMQKYDI